MYLAVWWWYKVAVAYISKAAVTLYRAVVTYTNAGPFKTCMWLLLTAAMAAGLIYGLTAITTKYLSYPSSVGIVIEHAKDVQFPAITICNASPVRTSRYNEIVLGVTPNRRRRSTSEGTLKPFHNYNKTCEEFRETSSCTFYRILVNL